MADVLVYKSTKGKKYKGDLKEILDFIKEESVGKVGVDLSKHSTHIGMHMELIENDLMLKGEFDLEGNIFSLIPYRKGRSLSEGLDISSVEDFENFFNHIMKIRENKNGIDFKFFDKRPSIQNVYFRKKYNTKKLERDLKNLIVMLKEKTSFDIDVQITVNDNSKFLGGILINGEYYFDAIFSTNNVLEEIIVTNMLVEDGNREPESYSFYSIEEFKTFFIRFDEIMKSKQDLYELYNIEDDCE